MATKGAVAARRELALKSIGESANRITGALGIDPLVQEPLARYNTNPDFASMIQAERLAEYLAQVASKVEGQKLTRTEPDEHPDESGRDAARPKRRGNAP